MNGKGLMRMGSFNVSQLFKPIETKTNTCEKHGQFIDNLFKHPGSSEARWSGCFDCQREKVDEENRALAHDSAQELERRKAERVFGRAEIPKRFKDSSLDDYVITNNEQKNVFERIKEYADNWEDAREQGQCLLMLGNIGNGKTHLAIGLVKSVIIKGGTAVFTEVDEAMSIIRETYGGDSTLSERQAIKVFTDPDLLVIDEVGRQGGKDFDRRMLFKIIHRRYLDVKPTVLISNLTEGLTRYLDAAAIDRLRERGGKAAEFTWDSYRTRT